MTDKPVPAAAYTTTKVVAEAGLLQRVVAARTDWLDTVSQQLGGRPGVVGAWLVGSMGRGEADAFSDVDLVVAVDTATVPKTVLTDPARGLGLPGVILYRRPKPSNAPAGGGYLAIGIDTIGLPLLVDVFVWPSATAAVPTGARVLFDHADLPRSPLSFIPLIDTQRTNDHRGSDPDDPGTVLMLVQLAAKHLVRGTTSKLASIGEQLRLRADRCDVPALRQVLDQRIDTTAHPGAASAVRAVHRLLDVVDHHLTAADHGRTQ